MFSNKDNVNILTALLVSHGIHHVVVCPGSRNAAIVHNMNECEAIECHPATDERSAAFMALGLRIATHQPVAVCVTSGSALLNTIPAAAEATYQKQGIVVISADRPREWIDQLDGQTIPQTGALGNFVGKSVSLPEPHNEDEHWLCNRLINEALLTCTQGECPSVHINVPITEPLFSFSTPSLPLERIIKPATVQQMLTAIKGAERPLIVVGQMAENTSVNSDIRKIADKITILAEQISCCHNFMADQMLHHISGNWHQYTPDVVVYIGGHTISKRLRQFLRANTCESDVWMISSNVAVQDVTMHASHIVTEKSDTTLHAIAQEVLNISPNGYFSKWQQLNAAIQQQHNNHTPQYSQMLAVKTFEELADNTTAAHYANSMSVRLGCLYAKRYIHCNRGINGIEGSMSVAAAHSLLMPVHLVIGDLSFFYDSNALWQQQLNGNLRILLLNNSQGAIFRNLHGLSQSPVIDSMVSAHHNATAEGTAIQYYLTYKKVTEESELTQGINWLLTTPSARPVILEVITDVNNDECEFKRYYRRLKGEG